MVPQLKVGFTQPKLFMIPEFHTKRLSLPEEIKNNERRQRSIPKCLRWQDVPLGIKKQICKHELRKRNKGSMDLTTGGLVPTSDLVQQQ